EWEARIDALMRRQTTSLDEAERHRLFTEVQTIFAEHLPMIQFVAPRIYVAVSTRVHNLMPTPFSRPQLLWAPDTIPVVNWPRPAPRRASPVASVCGDVDLSGAAPRVRRGARVHRVVRVAAVDALGARRLRHRDAWARRQRRANRGAARAIRA